MKFVIHKARALSLLISCISLLSIANPVDSQPGENMWHLLAAVGTQVDQLSTSQTNCCAETFTVLNAIESTIDSLSTAGCNLTGTYTALEALTHQVITVESKVENLAALIVSNFNSTFTALAAVSGSSLAGTFTLIETASQIEFTTQSKLDQCCNTIETLFSISKLCEAIPITQSDIAGTLTLNVPGGNYCLNGSITGNITIAASDITLNLNQNSVYGFIVITTNGASATLLNGKIIPPAPTSSAQSTNGALLIQGSNAQIMNITIECTPVGSTPTSINGLNGINATNNATITQCSIKAGTGNNAVSTSAGTGGLGITSTAPIRVIKSVIMGGNGGNGVQVTGLIAGAVGGAGAIINSNSYISESQITGGTGGNGGDTANSITGAGGTGGNGVLMSGNTQNIILENSIIRGGNGGNSGFGTAANTNNTSGGTSGIGVTASNSSQVLIDSCFIISGNGGQGLAGTVANASGANGGPSNSGVSLNSGNSVVLKNNTIASGIPGLGASGQGSSLIIQGRGGSSGVALSATSITNLTIQNNVIQTSNGMDGTTSIAGRAGDGGSSGAAVSINTSSPAFIINNSIKSGNGGNGTSGVLTTGSGGNAANGFEAIGLSANNIFIINNSITSGNGGNAGSSINATSAAGGTSGYAISSSLQTVIMDNTLRTGNGGNGSSSTTAGSTGGNGGNANHGININTTISNTVIKNNIIASLGKGGNGGTGISANGTGGNSSSGINIAGGPATQASFNSIYNTQAGGTGSTAGTNGSAIFDVVSTSTASSIFGNFASNIANATPYTISAQSAITSTPSVGIASSNNQLNNVHTP